MKVKDDQKLLRFLPDFMIKKSVKKGKYLYTYFVDFSENDLLCKTNVSSNFLQVIMSMYSSTISSIAFGEKHSEPIKQ